MDNKNTGIIATIVAVILCGCPGICVGIFAAITAAGVMPYTTTFNDATSTGTIPPSWGYAGLCVSLIFILIPVLIGFFTLRKKSTNVVEAVNVTPVTTVTPSEPLSAQPSISDVPSPSQPAKPTEPEEPLPPAI